jgi:hypothetical protein
MIIFLAASYWERGVVVAVHVDGVWFVFPKQTLLI